MGYGTVALTLNTWNHVALVRNGSTFTQYLNGSTNGTFTNSTNFSDGYCYIARNNYDATTYPNWYISNARVVKGTAVYTGAFTPPTLAPLTTAGSTSAASYSSTTNVNTSFAASSTSLLTNFTNAGIYDAAVQNNVTTVGNTQASTTVSKWSPSSMKFNGSGDYLSIIAPQFGTGDLTIECWFYHSAAQDTGANIICVTNGSAFGIVIHNNLPSYPNVVTFWCDTYSLSTPGITGTTSLVIGNWYYFALTRSSGVWRMYINGIQQGSNYTNATSPDRGAGYNLRIGGDNYSATRIFNGYIQDFRITKGVARYTANFSVPTLAFQTQ